MSMVGTSPAASKGGIPLRVVEALRTVVGVDGVLAAESDLLVYECDGFTLEKRAPDCVVFPRSTKETAEVVKICVAAGVPVLARGAGTSLSGGCFPIRGGVMVVLTRMNRIKSLDVRNRRALVEAGVVNLKLTQALKGTGYHYAPDPSSQAACTIGGNIATNSGGPHTLKYGVTVNHVLGVTVVTGDGSIENYGGPIADQLGLDLVGAFVGSEGTFGICTEAWVRLTPDPQAFRTLRVIFDSVDDATQAISEIIGAGIIPAALEMMDNGIIEAIEAAFHYGFPLDAGAMLIVEVDGLEVDLDRQRDAVAEICTRCNAREVKQALDAADRQKLWKCRKQAFGAIGRLSPSYCTQDGVVPRTQLPTVLKTVMEIGRKYNLRIVNVFHAGDGNIHPILLFDERDPEQTRRVLAASDEILDECLRVGGSITGEHGIGIEKLTFMTKVFTADDLDVMRRLRDAFDPAGVFSPGKVLPSEDNVGILKLHPGRRAPH